MTTAWLTPPNMATPRASAPCWLWTGSTPTSRTLTTAAPPSDHPAAGEGHTEVVRALLAADGIDANSTCTDDGSTALIYAPQEGYAEVVRTLLAVDGIDANHTRIDDGCTALILASQEGHAEIIRALLAVDGIDANLATTDDDSTALIVAAQDGTTEVARALLAVDGIDANLATTDDDSSTAHHARRRQRPPRLRPRPRRGQGDQQQPPVPGLPARQQLGAPRRLQRARRYHQNGHGRAAAARGRLPLPAQCTPL